MKYVLCVALLACASPCFAQEQEEVVPVGSVTEVVAVLPEMLPVPPSPSFTFLPRNVMQVACRTPEAARSIELASLPVYRDYAGNPDVDPVELTAMVGDTVNNAVGDMLESGDCYLRR